MRIVQLSNGNYAVQKTIKLFWLFEVGTNSFYDMGHFYLSKRHSDELSVITWDTTLNKERVGSDRCQRSLKDCQDFIKDYNEYKLEKEFKIVGFVEDSNVGTD